MRSSDLSPVSSASPNASADAPDQGALDGLREHGLQFSPVSAGAGNAPTIDSARAVKVATQVMQPVDVPSVYLGRLTDTGNHDGDDTTRLVTDDRLVFAVRMTGLHLGPEGIRSQQVDESVVHHELWMFVDAVFRYTTVVRSGRPTARLSGKRRRDDRCPCQRRARVRCCTCCGPSVLRRTRG